MKRVLTILLILIVRNGYKRANLLKRIDYFYSQGDNCFFSNHTFGTEPKHISFGNNVWVATRVDFITHDVSIHMVKNLLNDPNLTFDYVGFIKIGNNVFIGANSTVLPNVNITDNVIIGANSVVTKSISESGVYVGQPLKRIKSFEEFCSDCVENHTKYAWSELIKKNDKKSLSKARFDHVKRYLGA